MQTSQTQSAFVTLVMLLFPSVYVNDIFRDVEGYAVNLNLNI